MRAPCMHAVNGLNFCGHIRSYADTQKECFRPFFDTKNEFPYGILRGLDSTRRDTLHPPYHEHALQSVVPQQHVYASFKPE